MTGFILKMSDASKEILDVMYEVKIIINIETDIESGEIGLDVTSVRI